MAYSFLTTDRQLFYDLSRGRLASYGRAYLRAIDNGTPTDCWVEKAGNLSAGVQVVKDALAKDVARTSRIIDYLVEFHELLTAVQLAYTVVPAALVPGGGVSVHNLTTGKQVVGGAPDSGTAFLHLTQAQATGLQALLAGSGTPVQDISFTLTTAAAQPFPMPTGTVKVDFLRIASDGTELAWADYSLDLATTPPTLTVFPNGNTNSISGPIEGRVYLDPSGTYPLPNYVGSETIGINGTVLSQKMPIRTTSAVVFDVPEAVYGQIASGTFTASLTGALPGALAVIETAPGATAPTFPATFKTKNMPMPGKTNEYIFRVNADATAVYYTITPLD